MIGEVKMSYEDGYFITEEEPARQPAFVDEIGKFHCTCGATHSRGAVNGGEVYRCLGCGKAHRVDEVIDHRCK